ncbi:hypothetical protein JWH11_09120 [Xanthomonas melonis]|uniref:Type II secretion system protein GspF domain-containing protein n=2 Tax=Xanthomonas melonis TaxID=56456 RepID=A0ABS8NU51_9XANT|nr:hypothetical protein [Xanthomonas melonis]MCD0244700.1 hypothetical protein [Xanthomonas melonis]MCD0266597.1 hypothetical protein [Xanthomonas melonis]
MEILKSIISGAAVVVTLIGVAWGIRKDMHLRVGRLRDDFKFALELKSALGGSGMESVIKERGFHALVGRSDVPAPVIEYLISLRDPQRALRLYRSASSRTVFLSLGRRKKIIYKGLYRNEFIRRFLKFLGWAGYIVLYLMATSPLMIYVFKGIGGIAAVKLGFFTILIFFPAAVAVLRYGVSIKSAEALIALQKKVRKLRI